MNQYLSNNWKEFREYIIDIDGNKCTMCGKSRKETVLQVHHKRYIKGLKPWEYGAKDCVTLCRGCHASEHGLIKPKFGWEYVGEEDLGDLIGTCEHCGSSLRYNFYIFHQNWGTIEVGTYCCDNLTDSTIASNMMESQRKYNDRKTRFIKSKRWKTLNNVSRIKQGNFDIEIRNVNSNFFMKIHGLKSSVPYLSLNEAKTKAFDVIESGKLSEYMKKHNIKIAQRK